MEKATFLSGFFNPPLFKNNLNHEKISIYFLTFPDSDSFYFSPRNKSAL